MESLATKKVLVVDDNHICGILTGKFIQLAWIDKKNIVIAKDGFEAVEKAKKELFDVIIMDIQLPGIDGIEASQMIKSYYGIHAPKIIWYTAGIGFTKDTNPELFDAVVMKPVKQEELVQKLFCILKGEPLENQEVKSKI